MDTLLSRLSSFALFARVWQPRPYTLKDVLRVRSDRSVGIAKLEQRFDVRTENGRITRAQYLDALRDYAGKSALAFAHDV